MSDDLAALANNLQTAILRHLGDGGWSGRVKSYVHPMFPDALTVEITPEGFPAPGVPAGQHLVPAEAWQDRAARPELVAHLCHPYLDAAT